MAIQVNVIKSLLNVVFKLKFRIEAYYEFNVRRTHFAICRILLKFLKYFEDTQKIPKHQKYILSISIGCKVSSCYAKITLIESLTHSYPSLPTIWCVNRRKQSKNSVQGAKGEWNENITWDAIEHEVITHLVHGEFELQPFSLLPFLSSEIKSKQQSDSVNS